MEKISQKQSANIYSGQINLSFKEVEVSRITEAIPKGYRMPTLAESELRYNTDKIFREDMERAGSIWVLVPKEDKFYPRCARAYCGMLRVDNPESGQYRQMTNTAHVAYIRDSRVDISGFEEQKVHFKNALKQELRSLLY